MAWCRSTGLQQDEEEDERTGSRKKGRSRRCGPYREHSADSRYGGPSTGHTRLGIVVRSLRFPKVNPNQFFFIFGQREASP